MRFEEVAIEGITYRLALDTRAEDRNCGVAPEDVPYQFGEPIVVDRVLVTRLAVTPARVPLSAVPEYLMARASRPRTS